MKAVSFKAGLDIQPSITPDEKIQDRKPYSKFEVQLPGFAAIFGNIDVAVVRPTIDVPKRGNFDGKFCNISDGTGSSVSGNGKQTA